MLLSTEIDSFRTLNSRQRSISNFVRKFISKRSEKRKKSKKNHSIRFASKNCCSRHFFKNGTVSLATFFYALDSKESITSCFGMHEVKREERSAASKHGLEGEEIRVLATFMKVASGKLLFKNSPAFSPFSSRLIIIIGERFKLSNGNFLFKISRNPSIE